MKKTHNITHGDHAKVVATVNLHKQDFLSPLHTLKATAA